MDLERLVTDFEPLVTEEQYEAVKRGLFKILVKRRALAFTTADIPAPLTRRQKHYLVKLYLGFDLAWTGLRIKAVGRNGAERVYAVAPLLMPDAATVARALYKAGEHWAWVKIVEEYVSHCANGVFRGGPAYAHALLAEAWGVPLREESHGAKLCHGDACIHLQHATVDKCGRERGKYPAHIYTFL